MSTGHENFKYTHEPGTNNYLGVQVNYGQNGSFELKQTFLIEQILKLIEVSGEFNNQMSPAIKPQLHKDETGLEWKCKWNYRQVIGMLNYLHSSTWPDLAFVVHQAARFYEDPKLSHKCAVCRIATYLLGTKDRGIIYKPDKSKGLECCVDAGFAGGWSNADANNADNVLSCTGYVIHYTGCPIIWSSKLQTEITLLTAEAEWQDNWDLIHWYVH